MSTASTISMNELYTANIALSVFAMAIMLFSLRGDISQSKIRNLLCGGLYATIAICALCECCLLYTSPSPRDA